MAFSDGVPKRLLATWFAIAIAVCMMGSLAAAQLTVQPKAEVFAGYSWYHPNGYVDSGKVPDIAGGFDLSATYYLPSTHNLGIVVDGSDHFHSSNANVGFLLGGIQYKFRNDQFSPFVHVLGGVAHMSPETLRAEWKPVVGGGGGFDLTLTNRIALRIAQADYLWTYYNPQIITAQSHNWNSIRLSTGVVFNLGNYYTAPIAAACSASPTTPVFAGEPVTVTSSGTNFNPKHTVTYAWTATGGKLAAPTAATSGIDTRSEERRVGKECRSRCAP